MIESDATGEITSEGRDLLVSAVEAMGMVEPDTELALVPLSGGVSSLIARVETKERQFCVKAALEKLRVAADWHVPVSRNRNEVDWIRTAAAAVPGCAPTILGEDPTRNVFAMTWLDPRAYVVWKAALMGGGAVPGVAGRVGEVLGRIHSATADRVEIANAFATDETFRALRLDPYFAFTARHHPDLADELGNLSKRTAATRRALVHGDVSPKNILIGPDGPVFLDAECAWFGDPAFDLAFCLNHLVLKTVNMPARAEGLWTDFADLRRAYLAQVRWEDPAALEQRTATLLPALALARIDGKSPVEYLVGAERERVRHAARELLASRPRELFDFRLRWTKAIA